MRTRVRETGSGCLGSNGGPEPNGGCAMMSVARGVFWVISDSRIASNETQDERRRTRARVARSESAEVISKVERTAVRRSLHRLIG